MIVVDTAAVVDALTLGDAADELRTFLSGQDLHAPTLLDFEGVSALRGLTLGGRLSATRAEDALTDFDDLSVQRWPSVDGLRRRAFQLRASVSSYDVAYVALAEALDCSLVTRDRRLSRTTGHLARIEWR